MRAVRRRYTATPWCTCSLGKRAGFAYSKELGLWVESQCRRPSKLVWLNAHRQS